MATWSTLCWLRREQRVGRHRLAWQTGLPRSTIYAALRRHQLSRLDRLEPRPPVVATRPAVMVHPALRNEARSRSRLVPADAMVRVDSPFGDSTASLQPEEGVPVDNP